MPIFEYACKSCGAQFEAIVSRAQADSVACEACGAKSAERQLSAFGMTSGTGSGEPACASGACDMPPAHRCGSPGCCH